jgi:hypothetical protein
MSIYTSKNYRKIYEQYHGPIPIDTSGRTYDIHHIDGNHKNNNPNNLVAVSIQEHHDIHQSQGDWGACSAIIMRMKISPDELSRRASEYNIQRTKEGKNAFSGGRITREGNAKRLADGTHNFLKRPDGTSMISDLHAAGKGSSDPLVKEKLRAKAKLQMVSGRCAFVGPTNNLKRVANGTHPSQIKKTCPHCGKTCDTANYSKWHGDKCKVLKSE